MSYIKEFQNENLNYLISRDDLISLVRSVNNKMDELKIKKYISIEEDMHKINLLYLKNETINEEDLNDELLEITNQKAKRDIEKINKNLANSVNYIIEYINDYSVYQEFFSYVYDKNSIISEDVKRFENAYKILLDEKIKRINEFFEKFYKKKFNFEKELDSEELKRIYLLALLKDKYRYELLKIKCDIEKELIKNISDNILNNLVYNKKMGDVIYIDNKKAEALSALNKNVYNYQVYQIENVKELTRYLKKYEHVYKEIVDGDSTQMDRYFSYMLENNGKNGSMHSLFETYLIVHLGIRSKRVFYKITEQEQTIILEHNPQLSVEYVDKNKPEVSKLIFRKIMEELCNSLPEGCVALENHRKNKFKIELIDDKFKELNKEYINKNLKLLNNIWSRASSSISYTNINQFKINQPNFRQQLDTQLKENRSEYLLEKIKLQNEEDGISNIKKNKPKPKI